MTVDKEEAVTVDKKETVTVDKEETVESSEYLKTISAESCTE